MNRGSAAWLAVALLSISALGVSATTLESTMTTDANEVIELDYDQVPIGQDTASNLLDEIEGDQRDESEPNARSGAQGAGDATGVQPADSDAEGSAGGTQNPGDPQNQRSQEQRQDDRSSTGPEVPSLLDRILAALPTLLALVAVLVAIGLAVRYRDRLRALFEDDGADESADGDATAPDAATELDGSPSDPVERAWLGMVRHLDLDRPGTMTTSECASAAVEAGLDREAVRALTETYEEVRYGNRPVTDRREATARRSRRRLDVGGGTR